VAGGSGESDLELLSTTEHLYRNGFISRAYYSPFRPVENTPLENMPAISAKRENHLYQASFLLKDYGFSLEELPFDQDGNLPVERDPKSIWAIRNLIQPIEINRASRSELLKIPGIGPTTADTILKIRRIRTIQNADGLRKMGINLSKALPFILFNGKQSTFQSRLL
jgi:predicted DNA-binding helix-hairpin-helix protein